ncbi:MAG: LLM class flavin-dependent oxidoreductase [Deltaproteobacteria bacterium]|nr:LLM class flavin-dependent oxidoreductase [Deltaproteobacteria bacterium]
MQLGLILTGGGARGNVELGVRAENAGFDAVYACEFFNQQTWPVLGALAERTERIRLGTAIASAFVRSPLTHATASMDIDELSEGRMVLGLGSGTARMNREWFGTPFSRPAARMKELVVLLRELFAAAGGLGFRFEGDFFDLKIPVYTRPGAAREQIPVWIAAVNRGMIRAAGGVADALVGHPIATRRWHREVTLPTLREAESAADRPEGACRLAPYVMTSINENRDQAIQDAKGQIGFYYTVSVYRSILDHHGLGDVADTCRKALASFDVKAMADAIPDSLVDEIAIACTPDEARDRLTEWAELTDEALLYAPQIGVAPERVRDNLDAILDVFGQ